MNRRVIMVVWLLAYAVALMANLGTFWMGDRAMMHQLGLTVLYAGVSIVFLWNTKDSRRWMKAWFIWGFASVAAGVLCLLAREGIAWATIPALVGAGVLFAPLYGVTCLEILEDWDVFYGLMLGLGAVWTAVSVCVLRQLKD